MPPVCRLGTEPGEHSLYPQPYLTLTLTLTPMPSACRVQLHLILGKER